MARFISKMKKWIWIIGVIVLLGGGIMAYSMSRGEQAEYLTAQVDRGNVEQVVSVTGSVVSSKEIELSFPFAAEITEMKVQVGDRVKAADELVLSKATDFANRVRQAESAYNSAVATLEKLKAGAGSEEVQVAQVAVDNSGVALKAAHTRYQNYLNTSTEELAGVQLQVINAQSSLSSAQQNLQDTQATSNQNITNAQTAVTNAQSDVDNAGIALDDTKKNNTQAIQSAQTAVDNAEEYLAAAEDYLDQVEEDFDDDLATSSQVQSAQLQVTQAENAKNTAEEALDSTRAQAQSSENAARANFYSAMNRLDTTQDALTTVNLSSRMSENLAQAQVSSTQVALQIAQQSLKSMQVQISSQTENYQADVEAAQGAFKATEANLSLIKKSARAVDLNPQEAIVEQAQAALELATEQLENTKIIAPIDGVVVQITGEVGELVNPGVPVVRLIGESKFQIEANIPETDINLIILQDPVKLTFDAFSADEEFSGVVFEIEPDATIIQGVIYYQITVEVDGNDDRIKPGMTANLNIVTEEKQDVVRIPLQALKTENGSTYVNILSNGNLERRDVTIGFEGDTHAEVLSGLTVDEVVVTFIKE